MLSRRFVNDVEEERWSHAECGRYKKTGFAPTLFPEEGYTRVELDVFADGRRIKGTWDFNRDFEYVRVDDEEE